MNSRMRAALGAGILVMFAGCASVEKSAPPVALLGSCPSNVSQGRQIYLSTCTKCHGVKPVLETSIADWRDDVLPTMSKKAKLAPDQTAAVLAYVNAVHRAGPSLAAAKP